MSGVAAFSGLSINKAGTGYTLTAADGALTTATSSAFDVTPATAASFSLTNPGPRTAGTSYAQTVTALDSFGNVATGYAGSKTLVFSGPASSPNGAAPSYPGSVTFSAGVGVASITLYNASSTTLTATQGSLTGSTSFTVNPGPGGLVFVQKPTNVVSGSAMSPAVTVQVEDTYANLIAGAGATVTLAPSSGTIAAGDTASTNPAGLATFGGLAFDGAATGLTLTATSAGLATSGVSRAFDVTNVVTVTSPGSQTDVSGSSITPLPISAGDTSSTATLSYTDSGTLPTGLSIDASTGVITGTPTTAGSSTVTVTATDDAGFSGQAAFTWTVTNTVTVANPGDRTDTSGTAITPLHDSATDSSAAATIAGWSAPGLPAGLSIDASTGTVTGVPTTSCACAVTVTATDDAGYSGQASFTWTITNQVTVTNPGDQTDVSGAAIDPHAISASDSSSTSVLSFSASGLPVGLGIDATTGVITGTPTTACACGVTVTATDDSAHSGSASFVWTITDTVIVTNPGPQTDNDNAAITPLPISASDSSSTATLSYSDGGTLPAGLAINAATGVITGTPTAAGSYSVAITASDGAGYAGQASFTWTIEELPAITSADTTTFTVGVAGGFTVTATGAPTPALAETGALATGVVFTDNGDGTATLAGTPAAGTAGTYSLTISATSSAGAVSQSFTLVVRAAATTTALTSSLNPSGYGKAVTLTATVTGNAALGSPDGAVTFTDTTGGESTVICASVPVAAASSTTAAATCSYTPPATANPGRDVHRDGLLPGGRGVLPAVDVGHVRSDRARLSVHDHQPDLLHQPGAVRHECHHDRSGERPDPPRHAHGRRRLLRPHEQHDGVLRPRAERADQLGHVRLHPAGVRQRGQGLLDRERLLGERRLRVVEQPRDPERARHGRDHAHRGVDPAPGTAGKAIILSATVAGSGPTPTGRVSFTVNNRRRRARRAGRPSR